MTDARIAFEDCFQQIDNEFLEKAAAEVCRYWDCCGSFSV